MAWPAWLLCLLGAVVGGPAEGVQQQKGYSSVREPLVAGPVAADSLAPLLVPCGVTVRAVRCDAPEKLLLHAANGDDGGSALSGKQ